jgi:hypothetical protein
MRRLMAWTLGMAFVAGLVGPDALAVVFTALATFVLAFAFRGTPWRWPVLSLTAWATGAGVGALLTLLEGGHAFAAPSQAGAGVTVLAAYASAFAGAWVRWVATRLEKDRLPG